MSDVVFGLLIRCFQTVAQSAAAILPFGPQITPVFLCDHFRSIQAQNARFLFINLLQRTFNLGAFIRAQPSELVGHFIDIVIADERD
jgi:hypothetical protein